MVLRNQQTDALNFVKLFMKKAPFCVGRVGVIRPSSRKALRRKGLVEIAQISAILKKSHRILVGQGFRDFSR